MRWAAAVFCVLGLAAQGHAVGNETNILFANYDLDATSYTYGLFGEPAVLPGTVVTTATSTTVTAVDATKDIFANTAVGDVLLLQEGSTRVYRTIATKTSADEVEVDTAMTVTQTSAAAWWLDNLGGTGATSGWFPVLGSQLVRVSLTIQQMSVTGGIYMTIACKNELGTVSSVQTVYTTASYTAAGGNVYEFENAAPDGSGAFDFCRVGLLINSADDGVDTGAAAEIIDVVVSR